MSFIEVDNMVGTPVDSDTAQGEPQAPDFPLPVVMLLFLIAGYLMLRQVWNS